MSAARGPFPPNSDPKLRPRTPTPNSDPKLRPRTPTPNSDPELRPQTPTLPSGQDRVFGGVVELPRIDPGGRSRALPLHRPRNRRLAADALAEPELLADPRRVRHPVLREVAGRPQMRRRAVVRHDDEFAPP